MKEHVFVRRHGESKIRIGMSFNSDYLQESLDNVDLQSLRLGGSSKDHFFAAKQSRSSKGLGSPSCFSDYFNRI